jgi:phosphoribosylaminoimidazole-succinocarboxamide synthase
VIDEIHTPDSSRFWFTNTYQERFEAGKNPDSFDKDFLRRWLSEHGFSGDGAVPVVPESVRIEASQRYLGAVETLTGQSFQANLEDPLPRLRKNLGLSA